jgi:hypothetical protein
VGHDSLELDSMEPKTGSQIPWIFILGQRSCAEICLSGHLFLDLCSLSLEKGVLGSDMPV